MSYTGNIILCNVHGEPVFERELTQEEIIAELLAAIPDADADADGEDEEESEVPVAPPAPRPEPQASFGEGRPCCGSKGFRHKKDCPDAATPAERIARSAGTAPSEDKPAEGEPLTEEQWVEARDLSLADDLSFHEIADQLGVEIKQVSLALSFSRYESYLDSFSD